MRRAWWPAFWALACVGAVVSGPSGEKFEVAKKAVDFAEEAASGHHNATLAHACGLAARFSEALLGRLYFYAFVTTDDPELLEHFLEFYSGRGIRFAEDGRARIFVNPGLNRSVAKDRRVHHILTAFLGGAYGANLRVAPTFSSDIKRDFANDFLRELPSGSLLMFPDLDEFFDVPPALIDEAVATYGGFVLGHMIDRVARDWSLRHMHRKSDIWAQYPRRCAATHERFHASNTKWIVVPKRDRTGDGVRFTSAHHVNAERKFDPDYRAMPSHPFSHYRFGGHSYDLLKRKHEVYVNLGDPRAHIYDVILSYIDHEDLGTSRLNAKFAKSVKCGEACPTHRPRKAPDLPR